MNARMVLAMLTFVSCGAASTPDAGPDDSRCVRGTLESDLQKLVVVGPGADQVSGGSHVISSTFIRIRPTAAGQQAFNDALKPINAELSSVPGVLSLELGTSVECLTARTLVVWKDQAAMYAFSTGPAHSAAVANVAAISRGGSVVTHWVAADGGTTWDEAASKLAVVTGPMY